MWQSHTNNDNKNQHSNYEEEEEDPEWGEDDVTEYKNTKVSFRSIPSALLENAEKSNINREKVDVYNNKALEELTKPDLPKKKDLILTPKEQVFKNTDDKTDLFDQIESYLLQSNEKEDPPTKVLPKVERSEKETKFNPNEFFDTIDINNDTKQNKGFFDNTINNQMSSKPKRYSNYNNKGGYPSQSMQGIPRQFNQGGQVSPQQIQMLYNLQLQQLYLQQKQLQAQAQYNQMMQNQMMYPMMNYPHGYISPMVNMNMNMNMNINVQVPQREIPQQTEDKEEDDDDDDPIMNDPNPNFAIYNPAVFLENPALIVKKNFLQPNWFLMKDNKILGNYTSEELFYLLGEKIREGEKFENVCISDFQTDLVFQPKNLYEILKEKVPKLTKKFFKSKMRSTSNNNYMKNSFK